MFQPTPPNPRAAASWGAERAPRPPGANAGLRAAAHLALVELGDHARQHPSEDVLRDLAAGSAVPTLWLDAAGRLSWRTGDAPAAPEGPPPPLVVCLWFPEPPPILPPDARPERPPGLTAREAEVAALAAEGFTVLNVAARLAVAESTVKTHLKHIYQKLGVFSRVELARRLTPKSNATV